MGPVRAPLLFTQLQRLGLEYPVPKGYMVGVPEQQQLLQVLADQGIPVEIAAPALEALINSRYQRKVRGIVASYLFEGDGPISGEHPCRDVGLGLSQDGPVRLPSRICDAVHLEQLLLLIDARLTLLRRSLIDRIERSRKEPDLFQDQIGPGSFRMPSEMRLQIQASLRNRREAAKSASVAMNEQSPNLAPSEHQAAAPHRLT